MKPEEVIKIGKEIKKDIQGLNYGEIAGQTMDYLISIAERVNEKRIRKVLKKLYSNKYFMPKRDEFSDIMRAQAIIKEITK